jgi:uncharacterized protein (TIGR00255 family)
MAVYSMTGYASASCEGGAPQGTGNLARSTVTVEMRSVNGRFLDLSLRLPDELRSLEPALRELVTAGLRRGKVELRLNLQREGETAWPVPAAEQLNQLMRTQEMMRGWLPDARPLSVNEILQWCRSAQPVVAADEAALKAARECVQGLREARAREGARLTAVLLEKLTALQALAQRAGPLIPETVRKLQSRFIERWNEALSAAGGAAEVNAQAAQERALSEAATYAVRIDVAEELERLRAHIDELRRLLNAGGEMGKRLDFLIQELHREANTLGSKSAALELTAVSVEMKVLIEQMREQVQNIE